MKRIIVIIFIVISWCGYAQPTNILIESEGFKDKGGWVIDQQSMDQMGSPYLLAHGLGVPVEDAKTVIDVSKQGRYTVWVRTRNWVAPWNSSESPGKFQLVINGKTIKTVFGTVGAEWHWQNGGKIELNSGKNEIKLHDLTGFAGRCDAILFTSDHKTVPPNDLKKLSHFRNDLLELPQEPVDEGEFDLVVVGGGIAGISTAISAARLGCSVALIQNRPVLGGNNSSEVRVGLSGLINQQPYPELGKVVDEIGTIGFWNLWEAERNPGTERSQQIIEVMENHPEKKIHNAGPASNYGDDKKRTVVEQEKNIKLFLNTHINKVRKEGDQIVAVLGKDIESGKESIFAGRLFVDCTGDGTVGFLADADFRVGRESKSETGEERAPKEADDMVMGTSIQWYTDSLDNATHFPECPWAIQFTEKTCQKITRGDWNWETGMNYDQVEDIEFIRDYGFRAAYGNWDFLKNKSIDKNKFANFKLSWMAYIGGKRESRRLLGDVILKEQDILNQVVYPDASFTTTWEIDLHYPLAIEGFQEEPFLSRAETPKIKPYPVPYRCLYSRNVSNLFMAGRNISVTHVALGTIRVQRTTGMMGEVVGMAASICKDKDTNPRGVFESYLNDLKKMMQAGVPGK